MMKSPALAFSVVFLIVSTASALMGINVLLAKHENNTRKTFFAISMCLSIWAFGFAIAISAPTEQDCLFWRRVSAIGWGMIYAIILHCTLIFTERKTILSRKWVICLLYIPAIVTVYIFGLSNHMAQIQYRLVRMANGWTNVAVNNGWDMFFYVYLVGFSMLILLLLWRWMRNSPDGNTKKQARLLISSFGGSLLLGTVTDVLNNSVLLLNIPQMAPIAFLIPLIAIDYGMRKYRLMNNPGDEAENILTDSTRKTILGFMAVGFIASGILYFVTQRIIDKYELLPALAPSVAFFAFACAMLVLQRINVKKGIIENLFLLAAIITIPAITINFIQNASVTVWAFPFIFVILSILFNNRNLLIGSTISIFFTQLLIWIISPGAYVNINNSDFLARIVIFAIALMIAFYVNKLYISRLKENVEKNKYQRLISGISTLFVSISESNREDNIRRLLLETGNCFGTDSAFLYLFDGKSRSLTEQYVWNTKDGLQTDGFLPLPSDVNSPLLDHMLDHDIVIDDIGQTDAAKDLMSLHPLLPEIRAKSLLSLPIRFTDSHAGILGLSTQDELKRWHKDHVETLKIITNIISDSLTKLSAEKEIKFMAFHDFLTKLPNRLLFSDRMQHAINLARRTEKLIGVIFLDLDSFKSINDSIGHRVGDELIREVSNKLSGCVRASDTVSRFGGDEFLIMLDNVSKKSDLARVADSLMGLFEEPFYLQGQEIFITASAGIAIYPFDGEDTDTLVKNADIAMYNAKEKGKNQYHFCSEDLKEDVQYKVKLSNNLYRALDHKELCIYYQPQVNLQTSRIIGVEALLRWFHPDLGAVSPGIFIPLAEKTGIINSIGEWVLRESCRQIKQWHNKGLPKIRAAVNISVNQLRNPMFVDQVRNILAENDLDPQYLELELTESVTIKDPAYIVTMMNRLKNIGISLSIDDFGTEYSSLSCLKQLPVDRIKIDVQFVQGIDKNGKDKAISKIIINLAKSLGMKVTAEGVENSDQLSFLNKRLCDEVQGYFYYKPMPADEMERILYTEIT